MNALKTFLFFMTLVIFTASSSEGKPRTIQAVYTDWHPYTYQNNGKASGFEIEILDAVMKTLNIRVEYINYPWKRCLNNLKEGKADILVSLLKTPEREKYAYFPDTHISISKTVFFTKKDSRVSFNGSYEALKGFNIGVIMGFSYDEAFDKADFLKIDSSVNTRTLITKLLNDRHDLAAENQAVVTACARQMGVRDKIRFLDPPIHSEKLYVGFSKAKNTGKLCSDFSKELKNFKKSKQYLSILSKYGVEISDR